MKKAESLKLTLTFEGTFTLNSRENLIFRILPIFVKFALVMECRPLRFILLLVTLKFRNYLFHVLK